MLPLSTGQRYRVFLNDGALHQGGENKFVDAEIERNKQSEEVSI